MGRDSFVFYKSFYEALTNLDDATRLACYDAVTQYAMSGTEPELSGVAKSIFALIKPQIDANNRRYENGCKGAEYGKLGGRPKKNNGGDIDENPIGDINGNPNATPNENVNVNDNENVKEKESKKKNADKPHRSFVPPTVEEVKEYCQKRRNGIDAQAFVDFYASKGWVVGKTKMKDWQAAVRTWEQRSRGQPKSKIEIDSNFRNFIEQNQVIDWETGG